jgi:hypothetical protein
LNTRRFRDAQQIIAKAKLLLWVASRYRSGGIQVSERDLNDSSVNSYEKYDDAKKRHDDLIQEARELVSGKNSAYQNDNAPVFSNGITITDECDYYTGLVHADV